MTIQSLKRRAQRLTHVRGHRMQWGPIMIREGWTPYCGRSAARATQSALCRDCGAGVHLDTHPPANGIDIGGEAVALNCHIHTP